MGRSTTNASNPTRKGLCVESEGTTDIPAAPVRTLRRRPIQWIGIIVYPIHAPIMTTRCVEQMGKPTETVDAVNVLGYRWIMKARVDVMLTCIVLFYSESRLYNMHKK